MEFSSGHSRWWLICFECFQVELELRILVYVEEGKPEDLEKNPRKKNENNHKLNSHVISCPGVEPEPQLMVYPTRLISHLFCFILFFFSFTLLSCNKISDESSCPEVEVLFSLQQSGLIVIL